MRWYHTTRRHSGYLSLYDKSHPNLMPYDSNCFILFYDRSPSGRVIRTSSKGNYLPGRSGGGDITCCHLSSSEEWLWEIEGRSSHSEHLYLKTDPETGREGRSGVGLGRCLRSAQICQDMMKLLWKD